MEKEEKILSVQCKLNDGDFEDVFRIYNETEKTSDKSIGLITCGVLIAICIFITIMTKHIAFIFYAVGCLVIGLSYYLVPVNKKFIATNKLLFGEWREITFYPHAVTTMEIFDKHETAEMDAEEIEEATTSFSTNSLIAYENMRGFLFAENKIVNQFLYIPKRELSRQTVAAIQDFAQNKCSGGYQLLEGKSMLGDDETPVPEQEDDDTSLTSDICNQYYGAKKLHLYDAEGRKIELDSEEEEELEEYDAEADEELEAEHTEIMDAPELDIEEALGSIIAEDEAEDGADE
ncbi:MAG: hypothetical protein J6P20_09370 [Oscillospiraceae bacterium]|nr:hypothetical protein [Oscillospiraceae bacterium]